MKYIYSIIFILSTTFFFACQDEELTQGEQTGYLRLSVSEDKSTSTRAVPTDYKPEQIAVQIVNASGKVVEETEDAKLWEGQSIELPVGKYTVKAASNGFDGKDTGFDIPYYVGSEEITITADAELNETVICTLANVKVTVKYDADFVTKVASVATQVGDTLAQYTPLNFTSSEKRSAYFPAEALYASVTVRSKDGRTNTYRQTFKDVKARDHYMLNIKLAEGGEDEITVTVDPTTHEYSYTFHISTVPTNGANATVGAWETVAYLRAENITVGSGVSTEGLKFQYRASTVQTKASGENEGWIDVETTVKDGVYTAFVTGLNPATEYEYRLVNNKEEVIQEPQTFATESAEKREELYNGNFEFWSQSGETIYPEVSEKAGNTTSFWNTSNPGTTQGIGALGGALNPTTSVTSPVHTPGGKAAQLKSAYKIIAFAAASLYTGNFQGLSGMTANMEFGKPFTGRPIALKGYYKYTPAVINHVDRVPDGVSIESGKTMDQCAIFIALAKKSFTFNNGDESTFIDYAGDPNIIAYGELPSGAATQGDGYTEFTIPLKYKEELLDESPTHIIVVCSASKYGDYMTGGEGSTMYVDDFSLVYDGEPTIWPKSERTDK